MHPRQLHLVLALTAALMAAACAGVSVPPASALPVEAPVTRAPATPRLELARLAEAVGTADGVTEGAAIQMLAFREQVYLPFRYRQGVPIDGRGWYASEQLDGVRAGFERLGREGRTALERCVEEASEDRVDSVHLAGDDGAFFGRACLRMLADTSGRDALPWLVAFGNETRVSPTAVMLQRAALELLPELAPEVEASVRAGDREWRHELAAWGAWVKGEGLNLDPPETGQPCDERCEAELMHAWIASAADHLVVPGIDAPEPRYVATLREYLEARSERWVPWLADATKDALQRTTVPALEVGLFADLWATTSSHQYPEYFRRLVLPILAREIRPRASDEDHGRFLQSRLVVQALEHATGVRLGPPGCGADGPGEAVYRCLVDQARAWRSYARSESWPI